MTTATTPSFRQRVILLGASNVTLGLPVIADMIRQNCPGPIDIFSVHGLGRSYGNPSMVMGRSLPGILESELWTLTPTMPTLPTTALITDVGNDILYHVQPEQIAGWVEQCIDRLQALDAHISMTLLPVCNLEHLGRARYYTLRTLFFPTSRLSFEAVCQRAEDMNRLLVQVAESRQIRAVEPMSSWYAIDAIHVAPRQWRVAWPEFLDPMFCHVNQGALDRGRPSASAVLHTAGEVAQSACWMLKRPSLRWILGYEQRGPQPAVRYDDGTRISFY